MCISSRAADWTFTWCGHTRIRDSLIRWGPEAWRGVSQLVTRSTRHILKLPKIVWWVDRAFWRLGAMATPYNRLYLSVLPVMHYIGVSLNTAPAAPRLLRPLEQCCRGSKTAPSTAPADEAKHWGCNTHKNVISTCNLHFCVFCVFLKFSKSQTKKLIGHYVS